MAMPTPQAAAQSWANGMQNSTQKITAGVNAVTQSPTASAANAVDRMVAGIQRAAASGKIQAALNAVSLQDWKDAMINKGVPRVAGGAVAAKPKMQNFLQQFLPYLASGVSQLNSTQPRGELEQNIQRSVFMQRYNAAFKAS